MMIIHNAIFPFMTFAAFVLEPACMDAHHKNMSYKEELLCLIIKFSMECSHLVMVRLVG